MATIDCPFLEIDIDVIGEVVSNWIASQESAQGLYSPDYEHDACGVGFVAHIKGQARHDIIEQGLKILENLDHRGAVGADKLMGDGAGILLQIPDALYREEMLRQGVNLPPRGEYGVGMVFLPQEHGSRQACMQELERTVRLEGQVVLGWRKVPVNTSIPMSPLVRATEPVILQIFIGRGRDIMTTDALERKLYVIRKRTSHAIRALALQHGREYFVPSMSARTVVYKGQLLADQVGAYYLDLQDARTVSALAMVHQRFSTNTFPSWQLAHPYRMIAHNGEINTIKGNVNWINAREGGVASAVLGEDLRKLWPLTYPGQSDSACFDDCLELLVMAGYPLAHAMMMMIPEAWERHTLMDENRRAFYEYHAAMMEPWDGPAAMIFTDGKQIGATLDRNGLRPARFYITRDDLVVMASEAGVLHFSQDQIVKKGRLHPGKMFLLDMEQGCIVDDKTLKDNLANARPYKSWVEAVRIKLDQISQRDDGVALPVSELPSMMKLRQRQRSFAYSRCDLEFLRGFVECAKGLAKTFDDEEMLEKTVSSRLAVLSTKNQQLFDYFRQLFAQVTNPPIDAIRESIVMSLVSFIGPKPNALDINNINPPMRLEVAQPILNFHDIAKIREITHYTRGKFCTYQLDICYPVTWGKEGIEARIASLCAEAVDAIQSGFNILLISDRNADESHVAIPVLLATSAVHQHLVKNGLRTCTGLVVETGAARTVHHFALLAGYGAEAIHPYVAMETLAEMVHSAVKSSSTVSMEIETALACYIESIGRGLQQVMAQMGISAYMSYTGAQIFEAVGLSRALVDKYFTGTVSAIDGIDIFDLAEEALQLHQQAFVYSKGQPKIGKGSASANTAISQPLYLRDLLALKTSPTSALEREQVESGATIMARFMPLAITTHRDVESMQIPVCVSSNRQEISAAKLAGVQHIQIDMTPNADYKLSAEQCEAADVKTMRPLMLTSSPHHDVYSIEDLAQLIHDLKNVNPQALISIKLLSASGVGTVAAGVAKAKADRIIIVADEMASTNECALTHRGIPWEIGLAEVQQTLSLNGLRNRVCVQLEAPLKNGREVVIAALLGAEVFSGCAVAVDRDLQDKCDDITQRQGLATLVEEVRDLMAQLGVLSFEKLVGHAEWLNVCVDKTQLKARCLNFAPIFYQAESASYTTPYQTTQQNHELEKALDHQFLATILTAVEKQSSISLEYPINNAQRTVGTMLSGEIIRRYGAEGLPDNTIDIHFCGTAGQSFGAFLAPGITLNLSGDGNDYVGKGLSGGRVIVRTPQNFIGDAEQNIIVGNSVLYGAISGEAFFNGVAGERFAARNNGAVAVVEGVGEHGCEYMADGTVVILGETGRNFAAGMVGGVIYVYDAESSLKPRCDAKSVQTKSLTLPDQEIVKALIKRHFDYTSSKKAQHILEKWSSLFQYFLKIVPSHAS